MKNEIDNFSTKTFDNRQCLLGEGVFWHPERKQVFWFDILNKKLLSSVNGLQERWQFDEYVSAAGWVTHSKLLIAGETGLFSFDVDSGAREDVCALEAENVANRSNDAKADPWGGFWVSTMSKDGLSNQGAIYRYYKGDVRQLHREFTTPNSICFHEPMSVAYFSDTRRRKIYSQKLCPSSGWPIEDASDLIDFSDEGLKPDGAVTDLAGNLWCCLYGASRLICISSAGEVLGSIHVPVKQPTCPAFGGVDLQTLYFTSAAKDLVDTNLMQGQTFAIDVNARGKPEPQVFLS